MVGSFARYLWLPDYFASCSATEWLLTSVSQGQLSLILRASALRLSYWPASIESQIASRRHSTPSESDR